MRRAAERMAASVCEVGRQGRVSRSRAARNASRAPSRSPAAASARPSPKRARALRGAHAAARRKAFAAAAG